MTNEDLNLDVALSQSLKSKPRFNPPSDYAATEARMGDGTPDEPTPGPSRVARLIRSLLRPFLRLARAVLGPVIRPVARRYRSFMVAALQDQLRHEILVNAEVTRNEIRQQSEDLLLDIRDLHSETNALIRQCTGTESGTLDGIRARVHPTALRTGDGDVIVVTPVGCIAVDEHDLALLAAMMWQGELELGTRLLIQRVLEPGDTFIDVGANIGALTLAAGAAMNRTGRIIAIEPFPGNANRLRKSLLMNGLDEITTVHELAIATSPDDLTLFLGNRSGHHSLFPLNAEFATGESVMVHTGRIDDLVEPGGPVALMKIDVEGAELEVLETAKNLLATQEGIALIAEFGPSHLERVGIEPADWLARFVDLGFAYRAIDPMTGVLHERSLEELLTQVSTNIFFARPGAPIWQVLAS